MKTRLIIITGILCVLIGFAVAFAYEGMSGAGADTEKTTAFERMNDFDWSKTCPAAGCRNRNED